MKYADIVVDKLHKLPSPVFIKISRHAYTCTQHSQRLEPQHNDSHIMNMKRHAEEPP